MKSFDSRLIVSLLLMYIVWGSTYLGIRYAVEDLPPLMMAAMRFVTAGLVMLGWLKWRGTPWPSWQQARSAMLIGTMMLAFGNGMVCVVETEVPSGLAALLLAVSPLFAVLFDWAFGNRPHRLEWLGVALGLGGVVLLQQDTHFDGSSWGFLALLAVALVWSFAAVWQRRLPLPPGPMSAGIQMLTAGCVLAVVSQLRGEAIPTHVGWQSWAALAYLTVFGSLVAFNAFVYVLTHAKPVLASSYAYVNPPVAVLLGWLIAGERVSGVMLTGMGVVLAGVVLLMLASRKH
ncbi:drug/metabolite exporter YedA [Jeongeupia naejangsanensis]|uniref:Drug/metabolite exporter YedA n=1 Tax=Jeongeupia naejangsanensis TaxID=613195 RepID=A0ABS2BJK8_9NEIS|nr:drug/metabolite exporter YedA [Jeongeupia naejangsanensis]MBM3115779.1 drug/metabolite exporter YedA [Jeongeupia naejangsanensis]